jgi:integral membrane protein
MFNPVLHLRVSGFLEGLSYLILLLIAMPLKYIYEYDAAVSLFGNVHGFLFVWYVGAILWNKYINNITLKDAVWSFIASLIPFGTFWADKAIFKKLQTQAQKS